MLCVIFNTERINKLILIKINHVSKHRRRETHHVKETTEVIHNRLYSNEEDVTLRTGIVPDREPYVLVDHCKRSTW
jgi:hypothetical protein